MLLYSLLSSSGGGVSINDINGDDVRLFPPFILNDFNDLDDSDESVKIVRNAS